MPVFADGKIIAWTANIAHDSDVGGKSPGSLSADATEIFPEGLRLPAIKMISRGEPIPGIFDIIMVNSRMPDFIEGALWAAIASVRIGAKRLVDLAEKYSVATFEAAMASFMDFGEKVTLAELAKLPRGTFELTEERDDGRFFNVKVTISDTEFLIDLRDNPDQDNGPFNTSRDGVLVSAQMIFKSLTDPSSPANEGSFRPIRLLTRPGFIFEANEPAALGFYYEPSCAYTTSSGAASPRICIRYCPPATSLPSPVLSSAASIPIPAGNTRSSSRRSAAGAPHAAATAVRRSFRASTAKPIIARPRYRGRATASSSTSWS